VNGYQQQATPADARSAKTSAKSNAQAHLVRAAKMPAGAAQAEAGKSYETRNWCLFFFFRIMRQVEMEETMARLEAAISGPVEPKRTKTRGFLKGHEKSSLNRVKADLADPSVLNGGLVSWAKREFEESQRKAAKAAELNASGNAVAMKAAGDGNSSGPAQRAAKPARRDPPDLPAQVFRDWLNVLVNGDGRPLRTGAAILARMLRKDKWRPEGMAAFGVTPGPDAIDRAARKLAIDFHDEDLTVTPRLFRNLPALIACIRNYYPQTLDAIRMSIEEPVERDSPHGFLARMVLHEVLRQGAPLFVGKVPPVLRSEDDERHRLAKSETLDRTPITMAFSFSGLNALKLDENTLASFPEPFKQGMAARASRLGDVGRSAPENWEGELGLQSVHGYFTGCSNLERSGPLSESFWTGLRSEIRSFNDPTVDEGSEMRVWIGLLFRLLGLQVVHIELGQDPYEVSKKGKVKHLAERKEHFGFRDGLSQPFVDLGLGETMPGGGTADRRGTWSPVAPGEIFLDEEDESGQTHKLPLHKDLRDGSTYLVFRKLEQDVEGFRAFLEQQRPDDRRAQKKLAAQFFGRWPNGTSLVHSPYTERSTAGAETEAALNDFRYAAEDPHGRKCPLGAHVRRANPRDIGGRNDVRHHRILRRGIAYGGPLLPEGAPDNGEKRGILFIAANARIDLQFEVVQGDWLNGGEFLGQAGLGRCPISGAQDGTVRASFLEAGAVAPVTGLPSFVTMRGGDYFFAPGITALKGIAKGERFEVPDKELPYRGYAMGDTATPSLFSEDRLDRYWREQLGWGRPVRMTGEALKEPVTFVGRYDQVTEVLSNKTFKDAKGQVGVHFSVEPYLTAGRRITRDEDFLVGIDAGKPARDRLFATLNAAWDRLYAEWKDEEDDWRKRGLYLKKECSLHVRKAAKDRLDAALRRTAGARRIDLVEDLAAQAAYGVLEKVFGIRGPRWLSEMAGALPFARQHVGDLPRDWIAAFKGERPADPGLKTMQIWSTFLVADLIGNYASQQTLQVLARQAGSEMMNHIDQSLAEIQAHGPIDKPKNLLEAFLYNASELKKAAQSPSPPAPPNQLWNHYQAFGADWPRYYRKDISIILLEILGSTLAVVPLTFASVMTTLLRFRIDLSLLLPRLELPEGVRQIVYEGERLTPNAPIRFRRCLGRTNIGTNKKPRWIEEQDFVAAVIPKANMDRHVFWQPERFSLGKFDPLSDDLKNGKEGSGACPRDPSKYLLFGVDAKDSNKICWGRDYVAMPILEECLYACGRLQGLRRVAGPRGEPLKIGSVTIGLPARFNRVAAKDVREEPREG